MLSQSLLYTGREESRSGPFLFTCGPLSFTFDPDWAYLRTIRVLDREAIRAVYSAVRDQYWNTVQPRLSNLRMVTTEKTADITFDADCREGEIDFRWKGRIQANSEGTLSYAMEGQAHSTFLKNRIGFCVLHPLECAGRACTLEKVDGTHEQSRFPYYISPHQPFFNLRGLCYDLLQEVTIETRFEGDIFETEDQRNWTDASYKTYCTPLSVAHPALVKAGDRIRQSVTISVLGQLPDTLAAPRLSSIQSTVAPVGTDPVSLPRIGLCLSSRAARRQRVELKPADSNSTWPTYGWTCTWIRRRLGRPRWRTQPGKRTSSALPLDWRSTLRKATPKNSFRCSSPS